MNPALPYETITTGTTTWVQVEFTQRFLQPTIPPSPASGSIGLGGLTGTVGLIRETGFDGLRKPGVLEGGAERMCMPSYGMWLGMATGTLIMVLFQ